MSWFVFPQNCVSISPSCNKLSHWVILAGFNALVVVRDTVWKTWSSCPICVRSTTCFHSRLFILLLARAPVRTVFHSRQEGHSLLLLSLSLQIYSPQVIYLPVPFPPVRIFTALLLIECRLTVVGIPTIILAFFMTVSHIDLYVFLDFAVKRKIIYFHLIKFISN